MVSRVLIYATLSFDRFSSAAVAGIWLFWHISVRAAETTALFHPDPQHISNLLYRQLHVRTEPGGKEHGFDDLDPLLWNETNYLLDRRIVRHERSLWPANSFVLMPSAKSPTARNAQFSSVICGRFSTGRMSQSGRDCRIKPNAANSWPGSLPSSGVSRFRRMISRQLPDTYARALQHHEFPAAYDPASPNQAFLPPDLFDPSGPWICLGAPDHDLAAPLHDLSFTARSVFFVFARLPGGRDATLAYFKQLAELKIPLFVRMQDPGLAAADGSVEPAGAAISSRNRIRAGPEDGSAGPRRDICALRRSRKVFRSATTATFRTSTPWRRATCSRPSVFKSHRRSS